jgi:hypothetical protein
LLICVRPRLVRDVGVPPEPRASRKSGGCGKTPP